MWRLARDKVYAHKCMSKKCAHSCIARIKAFRFETNYYLNSTMQGHTQGHIIFIDKGIVNNRKERMHSKRDSIEWNMKHFLN